jgi:hypothetical protein
MVSVQELTGVGDFGSCTHGSVEESADSKASAAETASERLLYSPRRDGVDTSEEAPVAGDRLAEVDDGGLRGVVGGLEDWTVNSDRSLVLKGRLTWSRGTLTICAEMEVVAMKLPEPCASKMGPTAFMA